MHHATDPDPYWTHNLILGEGDVERHKSSIRLHLHQSEETYEDSIEHLFPISARWGDRIYFHAKPYILIPKMTLTIGLTQPQADRGEIGRVIGSDVKHLQEIEIGNAQAWYYPTDRALVIWECYLFEPYLQEDPRKDSLLSTVWQGFENVLVKELPDTAKLCTTYETVYERPVFTSFLTRMHYHKVDKVAFMKEVT
jgi:hypothetical protein